MRQQLNRLLDLAGSADRKVQNEALVDLALVIERSRRPRAGPDSDYSKLLEPDLLSMRLEANEQSEVIERLIKLAATDRVHPSMLWAIGKATPAIGVKPLLRLLRAHYEYFDDETTYQAIIALENFLVARRGVLFPEIAVAIREDDPSPILEKLANSKDQRVTEAAERVLVSLRRKV